MTSPPLSFNLVYVLLCVISRFTERSPEMDTLEYFWLCPNKKFYKRFQSIILRDMFDRAI